VKKRESKQEIIECCGGERKVAREKNVSEGVRVKGGRNAGEIDSFKDIAITCKHHNRTKLGAVKATARWVTYPVTVK
jgi:hypothetical protein